MLINNGQPEHAAVLLSTMFDRAKREMVVFCRNLRSEIYDQSHVIKSIFGALGRGVKIRILTQEKPEAYLLLSKIQRAREIRGGDLDRLELRTCPPDSPTAKVEFNFAVMDQKAFRYEPSREDIKAFACANDPELAKDMLTRFNQAFLCLNEKNLDSHSPVLVGS